MGAREGAHINNSGRRGKVRSAPVDPEMARVFYPRFRSVGHRRKLKENMNMEVNGARFGLRKNGMDAISMEHTGWAKVTKNMIFTLSAKSGLYLNE
jgi:hypothetical protein